VLSLLQSAYDVRKKHFGNKVKIHIINNVQNGLCGEDCSYCAQSKSSNAVIEEYSMKSDEEIMQEARAAYESGAFRHCLVFSGKGPSDKRTAHLARIIKDIKSRYKMEVCVSPGKVDKEMARILKDAGLDRINHNINTSENNYKNICSTHTYKDRVETLKAAKGAGLEICSGVIVGMGESSEDIIDMANFLHEFKVASIPVNFLLPIDGISLEDTNKQVISSMLNL